MYITPGINQYKLNSTVQFIKQFNLYHPWGKSVQNKQYITLKVNLYTTQNNSKYTMYYYKAVVHVKIQGVHTGLNSVYTQV